MIPFERYACAIITMLILWDAQITRMGQVQFKSITGSSYIKMHLIILNLLSSVRARSCDKLGELIVALALLI